MINTLITLYNRNLFKSIKYLTHKGGQTQYFH